MSLKKRIKAEINRLSSSHKKEDIKLINNVLRPMLSFINDHYKVMEELTRIGGKHSL